MSTYTYPYAYTHTRLEILEYHFELFLRAAGLNDNDVELFLESVRNQELQAVGIYIEENNYMIAEVEFKVDWELHAEMVNANGKYFSDNIPGWKDGVSPEAYVAVQRLVKYASETHHRIRSWIRVTSSVRNKPEKHKQVCQKLGYAYGKSSPGWKKEPVNTQLTVHSLPEATITRRFSQ